MAPMTPRRHNPTPMGDFEWSDTVPGPHTRDRIVRTPAPAAPPAVARINIVFASPLPIPAVTELDDTGWAEFQEALRRQQAR